MSVFDQIFDQSSESRRVTLLQIATRTADEGAGVDNIVEAARKLEAFVSGPAATTEPPQATPLYQLRAPEMDNLYGILLGLERNQLPNADQIKDGIAAIETAVMDRDGPLPAPGKLWADEVGAEEKAEEPAPDYPSGVNDTAELGARAQAA